MIPNFPDEGDFHFVEVKTGIQEDEKWILGGEDSCHVCTKMMIKPYKGVSYNAFLVPKKI